MSSQREVCVELCVQLYLCTVIYSTGNSEQLYCFTVIYSTVLCVQVY